MNILFCGGGTAGHISPALAMAETFIKKYPDAKIAFVGRYGGKENQLVKKCGFPIYEIRISGIIRSLSPKNIKIIKEAYEAKKTAKEIILKFDPDIVIGTGGYVSWPILSCSEKMKIPTVIHESNASLGLTTRMLAGKCDLLLLGAKINTHYSNAFFTGNPIRGGFGKITKNDAKIKLGIPKDKKLLLSVGGSIGAKKLNDACISLMANYSLKNNEIYHIHSTGHRYYDEIKSIYGALCTEKKRCRIMPFIEDMATVLSASDLVISRCGAMTLSEIAATGTPSILVPSPNVTGNHQLKNAKYFEENGAAIIIEENALSAEMLTQKTEEIFFSDALTEKMSIASKKLSIADANKRILKIIEEKILTN